MHITITRNPELSQTNRLQNNLAHLPTHIRVCVESSPHSFFECQNLTGLHRRCGTRRLYQLVVEFRDVRIIALGVLSKPRSSFSVNQNARLLLHPPGMTKGDDEVASAQAGHVSEGSEESFSPVLETQLPVRAVHRKPLILVPGHRMTDLRASSNQCEGYLPSFDATLALPLPCQLSFLHPWWRG